MSLEQPYRTAFHFQPLKNWMSDPNGPMYYNGVYHFFYQHNPFLPIFDAKMRWGHSVSYDLVNWTHLDIAIAPTEPYDINGCWSGSATILPGNKPIMIYTGIDSEERQEQNLAVPKDISDPYLKEWVKYTGNPVINLPKGIKADEFRDPSNTWVDKDGKWRLLVGSQKDKTGIAFLYHSDQECVEWTKSDSPLYQVPGTGTWEAPEFFPVLVDSTNAVDTSVTPPTNGVKHVLKVALQDQFNDYYVLGRYNHEKEHYEPETELTHKSLSLDYGRFYASKSFFDPVKNRRITTAWSHETDLEIADAITKGWAGIQSFPRSIWLDKNQKQLLQWPIEEIQMLHENKVDIPKQRLEGGSKYEIQGITASQADVTISFKLANLEEAEELDLSLDDPQLICRKFDASKKGKFGAFGILALASDNFTEQTAIFFRVFQKNGRFVVLMCSDQSRSSTRSDIDKPIYGAFLDIDPKKEEISLRTLIDHSIIESFGGGGKTCITARVYPTLAIGENARLFAFNNGTESVVISKLSASSVKNAQLNVENTFQKVTNFIARKLNCCI